MRNMLANKDNESADTIKSSVHELQQKSLKLFEMAYKKVFKESCILHRPLVKSAYPKITFLISQPKHMLWVLKRTVSMRWFL